MPFSPLALINRTLAPPPDADRVAFLKAQPFAHRGLHGGDIVENSRAAFRAAINQGLGIELDVRQAAGREAFVFHDASLDRLTDAKGPIGNKVAKELDTIRLTGTGETIPRLADILDLVAGQVPILIEVKADRPSVNGVCIGVRRALEGYRGPVAVMSFNPEVGRWFHRHAKRYVRGLVVTETIEPKIWAKVKQWALRYASLWRAKPDFLAYDINCLPSSFASSQRARGLPVLTWTVRTAEQEDLALAYADEIIFEKVPPVR
jgi:glycerophosphoryl diester phosphodiesterase